MTEFPVVQFDKQVFRAWALPGSVTAMLIGRGIGLASISAAMTALDSINSVVTPQDAVAQSFRPRVGTPPFSKGRFGDGAYPVLYGAQSSKTCIKEIAYHLKKLELPEDDRKYYKLLRIRYRGNSLDLLGAETRIPDLISETESGYPTCWKIAIQARLDKLNGLHTPSARDRPDGICTPVFTQASLSEARIDGSIICAVAADGSIQACEE